MAPTSRSKPQPLVLKVERSQAANIWEEWSNSGTQLLQDIVANRGWKSAETKEHAFDLARTLDVMNASGLDPTGEPACEVLLRALIAAWYVDRNPKKGDIAELLKKSSVNQFGIPPRAWEEAKAYRKLMPKTDAEA